MPDPIRQALLQLRREHPHAAAFTLAIHLQLAGLGTYTGKQVREWCAALDRQQAQPL